MKKNKINWGFFPDSPVKTQSIIEIILVIAIFVGCLRLFTLWYRVPEREIVINVEDLDKNYTNQLTSGFDINPESKYCNIYYKEQQTLDESKTDTSEVPLAIHFHKYKPYDKYSDLRSNHIMLDRFKRDVNKYGDDFEFKNSQALSNFIIEQFGKDNAELILHNKRGLVAIEAEYIDSLKTFCNNHFVKDDSCSINYIKYESKEKYVNNSIKIMDIINDRYYFRLGGGEEGKWCEAYMVFSPNDCFAPKTPDIQINPPNILSIWDISQSYYKFKVKSITVDSMNIKIDFNGASEFSRIYPEPDEIGLSYISYSNPNKISLLRQDGIEFLVKFKDLEGYQQIRLFAMTGIMGGLFTVLIFFIFLYPTKIIRQYKVIRKIEDEKQKQEETKSEKSTDEEIVRISTEDNNEIDSNDH